MSKSIITDFRPRKPEAQNGTEASRVRMIAGKVGRAFAYGFISIVSTPTAFTAHSRLGKEIRDAMGPSTPRPAATEITKLAVTSEYPEVAKPKADGSVWTELLEEVAAEGDDWAFQSALPPDEIVIREEGEK